MISVMQFGESDREIHSAVETAGYWQRRGQDCLLLQDGSKMILASVEEYRRSDKLERLEVIEYFGAIN